jgi:hypothetical protein
MRSALAALLLLAACDTSAETWPAGSGGATAAQGSGGSDGGADSTVAETVSVSVSVSATSAGGGGSGDGGATVSSASSSTASTASSGATTTGSGGGDACPDVPCDYGNGHECDAACGAENDLVCAGIVCHPYEAFTIGSVETTIRTPPINGPSPGCFSNCPGDDEVWWMARVRVRDGDCISAVGPVGSSVWMENPNIDANACHPLGENCLTISNLSGEDRFVALTIPTGMVTGPVVFTVRVYDGAGNCGAGLDCAAAGCNGAGG